MVNLLVNLWPELSTSRIQRVT